jgi:hypothetical protein
MLRGDEWSVTGNGGGHGIGASCKQQLCCLVECCATAWLITCHVECCATSVVSEVHFGPSVEHNLGRHVLATATNIMEGSVAPAVCPPSHCHIPSFQLSSRHDVIWSGGDKTYNIVECCGHARRRLLSLFNGVGRNITCAGRNTGAGPRWHKATTKPARTRSQVCTLVRAVLSPESRPRPEYVCVCV